MIDLHITEHYVLAIQRAHECFICTSERAGEHQFNFEFRISETPQPLLMKISLSLSLSVSHSRSGGGPRVSCSSIIFIIVTRSV